MKRKITHILFAMAITTSSVMAQSTHHIKIQLDTKKFTNIGCSMNADAAGGASPESIIYLHSGVCWQNPAAPADEVAASQFCASQISDLNSAVWQSVVGNWGATPMADGIGQMVNEGNGVFTKEFIVEQYYASSDVSTALEPVSNVTSQPMPVGRTAYTMGIVFRDPTGAITGRDDQCKDIFIYQLNTSTPSVIQGNNQLPWPNGPVTFIYDLSGIETNELFYERNVAPNPLTGDLANINFFVRSNQNDFEINVYDALGNLVRNVYRGALPAGKQTAHWDAKNSDGQTVSNGMYYFTMRSGNNMVTDKIIVNR